jgi:hypothetical protein
LRQFIFSPHRRNSQFAFGTKIIYPHFAAILCPICTLKLICWGGSCTPAPGKLGTLEWQFNCHPMPRTIDGFTTH